MPSAELKWTQLLTTLQNRTSIQIYMARKKNNKINAELNVISNHE